MRGRSCSKKQGMEVDKNLDKLKEEEEPHLSGAYIRSLVKQLTSSRTKDPPVTDGDGDGDLLSGHGHDHQNITKIGRQGFSDTKTQQQNQQPHQQQEQQIPPPHHPQQQQHKKQVRRRLHTSRPYQERLLNMAEARREIVTALKFHRASMKQANNEHAQSQTLQRPPPPLPQSPLEQQVKMKSRRNPRIYASTATAPAPNFPNYRDNLSYSSSLYSPSPNPPPPYWAVPPVAPPPPTPDNFNLNLPNQTLGLNLNFHDFSNLDTTLYHNPSPSTYYYSSSPICANHEIPPYVEMSQEEEEEPHLVDSGSGGGEGGDPSGLHQAMDDEEMAEIRSLGEQHQMEWNDTMNLVTSAWWFKFLKTMEIGPEENAEVDDGFHPLVDQVMEFPAWLNANESCLQQHLDDHCSDDYLQDPALPW